MTETANAKQLRAWDGEVGALWAAHADRFDEGVAAYHGPFLDAAAIEPTDAVLDIGCGNGLTTRDAARRAVRGSALGVDLSTSMLQLARRRAGDVPNATFRQADAQTHAFEPAAFDVAISRHGSMFFDDPVAAFANIGRALRPGGRLVLLTWQSLDQQEWLRAFRTTLAAGRDLAEPPTTSPSPMSLSDPDRVRDLLSAAGFVDVRLTGLNEPMYYGTDVDRAFRYVAAQQSALVVGLDEETRARALDALRADLADHETDRGVLYASAAWLVEARRASAQPRMP